MNVKLNLKVLKHMDEDFNRIIIQVSRFKDKKIKDTLFKELDEKKRCVKILFDHYKAVLNNNK